MKKRFKSKNKKNRFIKLIIIILIIYFSFALFFKFLSSNVKIQPISNQLFLDSLINTSFNNDKAYISKINTYKSISSLVDLTLGEKEEEIKDIVVPPIINNKDPIVYIYNTHQTEEYNLNNYEVYSIVPSVKIASYILEEELNNYNIASLVEENSVSDVLKNNGWSYKYSYKASRVLLDSAIKENPTLKYFIDIHRDSSIKEKTTTLINNVSYARVLFVVGREHDNYEANLQLSNTLNDELKKIDESLSRGISLKYGAGVNGIYNQDVSPNAILIEIGGQYNSIDEVNNTTLLIAEILSNYINNHG